MNFRYNEHVIYIENICQTHVQKPAHFRHDKKCTNNANVKKDLDLNTKEKGSSITDTGGEMIRTSPK